MVARRPTRIPNRQAFDDHLSWTRRPTPFLSFFSNWDKALAKRRQLLERGANGIVIIAIWAKDLQNVYGAYDIALGLGFTENNQDRRRRLGNHFEEYLVAGGIHADDYRILATFYGDGPERSVSLSIPGLQAEVTVPSDFARFNTGTNAMQELEDEVYRCTGIKGNGMLVRLFLSMSRFPPLLISYQESRV
ncbi:hypothetical protein K469DRAFT_721144, partial [Zopfia rhizophila CBS 207.26]